MFRLLGFAILLMNFADVEAYGNHECIKEKPFESPGFYLENCTGTAEFAVKWNTKFRLWLSLSTLEFDDRKFKLIVNDQCTLEYRARDGYNSFAKWTNKNKKVIECLSINSCELYISAYGNLKVWHNDNSQEEDLACDNVINLLNYTWAWTKFRVVKLPTDYSLDISIYNSKSREDISEHILPKTPELTALEKETRR